MPEVRKLWATEGLFSDHYLKARLKSNDWWPSDTEAQPVFQFCKELYEKRAFALRRYDNEMGVRQEFIDKILERLGFAWSDNLRLPETDQELEPDYILYPDGETKESVLNKSVAERYRAGVGILEAKKFGHPLSQMSKSQKRYPHRQIREYLDEAQVLTWGILTNGNEWRLYCRATKPSHFFAINFELAIRSLEDFKVFLVLFSSAAFARDNQGKCRLDQVRENALATQAELEADLRTRVFTIVEILANGFAERPENKITDADLPRLYENCLIFLYRLLFILYAEGRQLLPVEPKSRKYYKQLSLARLLTPLKNFTEYDSQTQTRFYRDIHALCLLINGTDKKANDEFKVPRYNGGLFDPDRYPLLNEWAVADAVLADVLRQLMFTPEKAGQKFVPFESVDYADLSVQQLGSIYEGLLENHFVRDGSKLVLKTDKAERKATGTYYSRRQAPKFGHSLRVRIGPEHFEVAAVLAQELDGLAQPAVFHVSLAIYKEDVLPGLALAGPGFDLGHVDAIAAEGNQRAIKRPHPVREAEHQARAVLAGGRTALPSEDQKPGGIGDVVLDVVVQHGHVVSFGGQDSRNGGGGLFFGRQLSRSGIRGGLDDFDARQVGLDPGPALPERLRMGIKLLDLRARAIGQQTMLHRQDNLRDDLQVAINEHVKRVRHNALGGVFDRDHAIVRAVLADLGEDVSDGLLRGVTQAGAEAADCRLVGERRLRPKIGNRQGLLERQGAGHDLPVNRPQRIVGKRTLVLPADPLQHRPFAVRRVNLLAGLALHFADGQDVFGPLVQELDELRVELVDGLAMFENVHSPK
jgi:hypothetical protein